MALKILLADDSMTAQNMGRKILTDAGYDVTAVSNGAVAVKKMAEVKPDIVLLDVYMPGYSGLEVCRKIKNSSLTGQVPVLLTVGKLEPFRTEDAMKAKADGFIIKPFEASDLIAVVRVLEERIRPATRSARAAHQVEETDFEEALPPSQPEPTQHTEPDLSVQYDASVAAPAESAVPELTVRLDTLDEETSVRALEPVSFPQPATEFAAFSGEPPAIKDLPAGQPASKPPLEFAIGSPTVAETAAPEVISPAEVRAPWDINSGAAPAKHNGLTVEAQAPPGETKEPGQPFWRKILRRAEPVSLRLQDMAPAESSTLVPDSNTAASVAAEFPVAAGAPGEQASPHETAATQFPARPPMPWAVELVSEIAASMQPQPEASEAAGSAVLDSEPAIQPANALVTESATPSLEPIAESEREPEHLSATLSSSEEIDRNDATEAIEPPLRPEVSDSDQEAAAEVITAGPDLAPAADLVKSPALPEAAKHEPALSLEKPATPHPAQADKGSAQFVWRRILRRPEPLPVATHDLPAAEVATVPPLAAPAAPAEAEIPASVDATTKLAAPRAADTSWTKETFDDLIGQTEAFVRPEPPIQPHISVAEVPAEESTAGTVQEAAAAFVENPIPALSQELTETRLEPDKGIAIPLDSVSPEPAKPDNAVMFAEPVAPSPLPESKEAAPFDWQRILRRTEPQSLDAEALAPAESSAVPSVADLAPPALAEIPASVEPEAQHPAPPEADATLEFESTSPLEVPVEPVSEIAVAMLPTLEVIESAEPAASGFETLVAPDTSAQPELGRLRTEVAGPGLVSASEAAAPPKTASKGIFSELQDSEIDAILSPFSDQHEVIPPAAAVSQTEHLRTEIAQPAAIPQPLAETPVSWLSTYAPTQEAKDQGSHTSLTVNPVAEAAAPEAFAPHLASEPPPILTQEPHAEVAIGGVSSAAEIEVEPELASVGDQQQVSEAPAADSGAAEAFEEPLTASPVSIMDHAPSPVSEPEATAVAALGADLSSVVDVSAGQAPPDEDAAAFDLTSHPATAESSIGLERIEISAPEQPVEPPLVDTPMGEATPVKTGEPADLQEAANVESAPSFWRRIFRRPEPISLGLPDPTPPEVSSTQTSEPKSGDIPPGILIPSVEPVVPMQTLSDGVAMAATELVRARIANGALEPESRATEQPLAAPQAESTDTNRRDLMRMSVLPEIEVPTAPAINNNEDKPPFALAGDGLDSAAIESSTERPQEKPPTVVESHPPFVPAADSEAARAQNVPPIGTREPTRRPRQSQDYPHFVPLKPESGRPPVAFVSPRPQRPPVVRVEPERERPRFAGDTPVNERPHFVPFHTREEPPTPERDVLPGLNENRLADNYGPPRFRVSRENTQEHLPNEPRPASPREAGLPAAPEQVPAEQDAMALEIVDRVFQSLRPALMDEVKRLLREKGPK